jgi:hypothetical protein
LSSDDVDRTAGEDAGYRVKRVLTLILASTNDAPEPKELVARLQKAGYVVASHGYSRETANAVNPASICDGADRTPKPSRQSFSRNLLRARQEINAQFAG